MNSSHICHTSCHEQEHHEIITINNYFCQAPIPPCFSWQLLENMVRPKGTAGGQARPEVGKK